MGVFKAYSDTILLGLTGLTLLLLILVVMVWFKQSQMRKNYLRLLNGNNTENVEQLLIGIQNALNGLNDQVLDQGKQLHEIHQRLRTMKSRVGIERYNAFAERGSDLSFSIAIVDEQLDGVVITGIHNREETYLYAKPIHRGDSTYTLTPEEKEAISRSS